MRQVHTDKQDLPGQLTFSRFSRRASGPAGRCLALLAVLVLAAACGSGSTGSSGGSGGSGSTGGSGGSGGAPPAASVVPPLILAIAATPPDIPSTAPACGGYADVPLIVPASLESLVSACVSPVGDVTGEMVIYNLSDYVIDIEPVSTDGLSQPAITPYYGVPAELLPSPDSIEVYAQNAAVAHLQPASGGALLPVGGHVIATQSGAVHLTAQVDSSASDASYGAQLMTGYVVDNLIEALPEDSAVSYEASIVGCVNAADSVWDGLNQQPPESATDLMSTAIETVGPCQDLQHKLAADHSEEIAVAARADHLNHQDLTPDLEKVTDTAGEDGWDTAFEDIAKGAADLVEHVH